MVSPDINIIIYFAMFYMSLICFFMGLYLRSMYVQYKNAHDKWHDIEKDYDKRD